jgi:hypothetical protein
MNRTGMAPYPDISDILARKAEGRRDLSNRTFGEKIAAIEQLRERLEPLKQARERRAMHASADFPQSRIRP